MNYVRRFFFVHYRDLLALRLKRLEKVSDKLYVYTPAGVEDVPLALVRQLQRMGPDLEWVDVGNVSEAQTASIVGFHVGTLHEQVDLGVEFALLSDDVMLDALVDYVQATGRSCVRVRQHAGAAEPSDQNQAAPKQPDEPVETLDLDDLVEDDKEEDVDLDEEVLREPFAPTASSRSSTMLRDLKDIRTLSTNGNHKPKLRERLGTATQATTKTSDAGTDQASADPDTVAPLADELVRRLIRSGNRPGDLPMLRSYILLHADDAAAVRHVDDIIDYMAQKGEIRVDQTNVKYNF